jgi:hypothetical protein
VDPGFNFVRIAEIWKIGLGRSSSVVVLGWKMARVTSNIALVIVYEYSCIIHNLPGNCESFVQLHQHTGFVNIARHATTTYNLLNGCSAVQSILERTNGHESSLINTSVR